MPIAGSRKGIKLGPLLEVQGGETKPVDSASAGRHRRHRQDGRPAHRHDARRRRAAARFRSPRRWSAWPSRPRAAATKPSSPASLHKIVEEDSTFKLDRDPQTKELVMTGMSELHLQIIRERLHRRDKLEVDTKQPKIPYRETIQTNAEGSYRHKKQSGGRGQFGEVHIRMYPVPARHQARGVLHQGPLPVDEGVPLRRRSTTSCGSTRSSAARFPATSCRPSRRASRSGWRRA